MKTTRRSFSLTAIALLAGLPLAAAAQPAPAFPSRTVTLIAPTPAAGPSDSSARLVARALSTAWGQAVVVENKAGAGAVIGAA
jgi:tripartite-type tricarboxylate transporter receptor subunit TctC